MSVSSSAQANLKPVFYDLRLDESANVERYLQQFRNKYMFVPGFGWYLWSGKSWTPDVIGQSFVDTQVVALSLDMEFDAFLNTELAKNMTQDELDKKQKLVALFKAKSLGIRTRKNMLEGCEPELGVRVEDLNADPWSLVVRNGTLDLRTGQMWESKPEDLNTQIAAVEYDPDAQCPRFDEILRYAFDGDEEMIAFVWRVLGYTLTGLTSAQSFFFMWGKAGSGKSTICKVMHYLLGDYSLILDRESIVGTRQHPTWIADILGKRMLFVDELEQTRKLNTALINTLVSGGAMRGRKMRKDFVDIPIQGKLFITTNHRPPLGNAQDGIYRRLKPVFFPRAVEEKDKIDDFAEMLADVEGAGILNRCIAGLLDYLNNGPKPALRPPTAILEDVMDYKASEDEFTPFMDDILIQTGNAGDWVANADLRRIYEAWCQEQGYEPITSTMFSRQLSEQGFKKVDPLRASNVLTQEKKLQRGFKGVKLNIDGGWGHIGKPVWVPVTAVTAK